MIRENKKFIPDIRVSIFIAFVSSVAILIYKNESTFIVAFVVAIVFILIQGQFKKALTFVSAFLILFLLSHLMIGITKLQTLWLFATIARHLFIPLSFLSGISDRSTGMILEVFHRLHLPKSFGISSIILMRFMPTIKYELNAIRGALKFRGIGVSLLSTFTHLPKNFYLTLIPLLIRTVRISDEITAAALTRGIELDNNIVSFSEVKWTNRDSIALMVLTIIFIILGIIEIKWGWKI
ncbi:hypothetical protein KLK89_14680 [Clostridioides difficile]|nr:energy-coupling factor transporter transmembrane component T [Clostridioides difficile]MDK3169748.1 energy-coupling factor transporter transmembrane component T [Clostridioides difficile]MDN9333081.1 hypothetical protein [Clostridioides difficile]